MRAKEFVTEHKKNRRAKKYNLKPEKPRNFVAKNMGAATSGAGAHTDKKKASKQGYEKHKNKEMAEGIESAEHAPTRYTKDLYVENTPEGVILYGSDIEIDSDPGMNPRGWFDFYINLTTGDWDITRSSTDTNAGYPLTDYISNDDFKGFIDDIVGDFKQEYGTSWEEINDELHGGMEVDVGEGQKFPMAGKYKQGPAGQWRNKGPSANRPAKRGDLVGGST